MGCEEWRIFVSKNWGNGLFKVKCGLMFIFFVKPSHLRQTNVGPQFSLVPGFFVLLLSLRRGSGEAISDFRRLWQWWKKTEKWLFCLGWVYLIKYPCSRWWNLVFSCRIWSWFQWLSLSRTAENPMNIKSCVVFLWDSSWNCAGRAGDFPVWCPCSSSNLQGLAFPAVIL